MIKVIVFDFDGTLVDSNAIKRDGFFRLAARYPGGAAAMTEIIKTPGDRRSILAEFSSCMAAAGVRLDVETLVASYGEHVDAAVAAAPEMEGASDLLFNLRHAGLTLHLSSATPAAILPAILETRSWSALFSGIYGSPTTKFEALQNISAAQHASNEQVAVVGDGVDDANAAKLFGAHFIAVGSGSYAVANPDTLLLTLQQVCAQVRAL